ncbi:Olfactory receptor 51I1 [Fukomys damarensis]|uniref:Olfactory receptor 51I1 n=1 Tax=Fukomys damarensis TaxID=885580 RepID=A0A091EKH6_FUKDA|nr:Olfactory receptor 51I1 [Fukomys damarensis]
MELGVLLAMSVGLFVAIDNPLCYAAILTLPRIAGSGAALGLKSVMLMLPLSFLLKHLPFCGHNTLSHSYCLHSDLIQLPCGDTHLNSVLGLCIVTSTFGLDSAHRCLLRADPLHSAQPQLCVALVHHFMKGTAPAVCLLLANVYLLVPPVPNPIIYSVKTKQIRQGLVQLFLQRKY